MWTLPAVDGLAPASRGAHASVALGTKVLVFGGADRTPTAFNDLWLLETESKPWSWTRISPTMEPGCTLTPRSGATLTVVDGQVYLFGGQEPNTGACFNDVKQLDPSRWHWSNFKVEGSSPPPRHSHCTGCLAGACLLVYAGAGQEGPLSDVWILNVAQRAWTRPNVSGTPPPAREMHSGTMVNDTCMLVFGGRTWENRVLCDAALLDASQMKWTAVEPTPFSRCAHTAVLLPSHAAHPQAVTPPKSQGRDAAAAAASPSPSAETATAAAPAAEPASGSGSGAGSTCVVVYGGYSGEAVEGDVLKIDASSLEIELLRRGPRGGDKSGSIPAVRFAHSAAAVAGGGEAGAGKVSMVVFGGVNPHEDLSDVAVWGTPGDE